MNYTAADETASPRSTKIKLHGPDDFAAMRKAGRLTAEALDLLTPFVKPGVTTDELDRMIVDFARDHLSLIHISEPTRPY